MELHLYPALTQWLHDNAGRCTGYDMGERIGTLRAYRMSESIYSFFMPRPHKNDSTVGYWAHLVLGDERAMLIDTGFGLGDFKQVVDTLTGGKELIVVNTHGHGDHTLGNYQFDTVYCHKFDAPSVEKTFTPEYRQRFCKNDMDPDFYQPGDLLDVHAYEVVGCENHHVFTLGPGHEVELLWLPGHSSGSCCYLDKKHRALFCGDAMGCTQAVKITSARKPGDTGADFAYVACYQQQLESIVARLDEFDTIYDGHSLPGAPAATAKDLLTLCDMVLSAPDEDFEKIPRKNGDFSKQKSLGDAGIMYMNATLRP